MNNQENTATTTTKNDVNTGNIKDNKTNDDKKLFVGGISSDIVDEDLAAHFREFGNITNAQIKYDKNTGRSRGFAFIEFSTGDACKKALETTEHNIKGKKIEVKPAKSRENKKVFIGGLDPEYPEEELRKHFEQFGIVEDIEWPLDKTTKTRRNYAFVVFDSEVAVQNATALAKQTFGSRECDVKKALPQNKKAFNTSRNAVGMMPGYHGNIRGNTMMQNPAQWYGGWNMNGMAYPPTAAYDWYNAQHQTGNFYPQNAGNNFNYVNGYDYNQQPAMKQTTTNGINSNRYMQHY